MLGIEPQPFRAGLTFGDRPSPGFPVELGGFDELHAPFFMERRTRGSLQCSVAGNPRPGLAPVAIFAVSFLPQLAAGKLAARDDKGEGGASIWCDGGNDTSQALFISPSACRRQVAMLLMTQAGASPSVRVFQGGIGDEDVAAAVAQ